MIGLYNPAPDGKQALPSYGLPLVGGAVLAAIAFAVWERFARTRLIEPAGVRFGPFLSSLGTSMCAGAALMVTLVNVELFGQGVLGKDQTEAAFLLLHFLIALPIGALVGGWIATKVGDRVVAVVGMLIAAGAYYLVSEWGVDVLSARHHLGPLSLPALDTDLALAGLGLGLVIGPLTSAALRVVPVGAARHRILARRGGPDDRNADRRRSAHRMGSVPVQPDPRRCCPPRVETAWPPRSPGRRTDTARHSPCSTARSSSSR